MHIVTCRPGHTLEIKLRSGTHRDLPGQEIFSQGNIEIFVGRITQEGLRLAIVLPRQLMVTHNRHHY